MDQDGGCACHLLVCTTTYSKMRYDERGGALVGLPPTVITEMRSGIRVARGALSVRPSARLIQLGVKNEKCHERRHQIILRPKREEERRGMSTMHLRVLRGKKLACRSYRMEERKRGEKKSEFCSWTLFILPPPPPPRIAIVQQRSRDRQPLLVKL